MIRYIVGDILNSNEDIIVQQVNCQNVMGSGFETCLRSIADRCQSKTIAIPHGIGCGLANGKWEIVSDLIHLYLDNLDVVIYQKQ